MNPTPMKVMSVLVVSGHAKGPLPQWGQPERAANTGLVEVCPYGDQNYLF
jgi:hypothetical protein